MANLPFTDVSRRKEDQHRAKEETHRRQLDAIKQEAAKAADVIHAEHQNKETELQRQLDYIRKTAETEKERAQRRFEGERADLKATIARLEAAVAEAGRIQRKTEAERAELQANVGRLEVDLMKVWRSALPASHVANDKQANKSNKSNTEALQAARDDHSAKLSAAESRSKAAETQASDLETQLAQRDEELDKVLMVISFFRSPGAKHILTVALNTGAQAAKGER